MDDSRRGTTEAAWQWAAVEERSHPSGLWYVVTQIVYESSAGTLVLSDGKFNLVYDIGLRGFCCEDTLLWELPFVPFLRRISHSSSAN